MSYFFAHHLSYTLPDGRLLFQSLDISLQPGLQGLTGANGSGKSVLLELLAGQRALQQGSIQRQGSLGYFAQLQQHGWRQAGTVADLLQLRAPLEALPRILAGSCAEADFEVLAERWTLADELAAQLQALGLSGDVWQPCAELSGGQLSRLLLWQLFRQQPDWLLLDEPGNHLDASGRAWLQQQLLVYPGAVLLISHDACLLEAVPLLYQLQQGKLQRYGGGFSLYQSQQLAEQQAVTQALAQRKKEQRQLEHSIAQREQKAQRRARSGKLQRASGSQSKLLLDARQNSAEQSGATRKRQADAERQRLQQQLNQLTQRQHNEQELSFQLPAQAQQAGEQLRLQDLVLCYGSAEPVSLVVSCGNKLWLQGNNGTGKSVLLRTISGSLAPTAGLLRCSSPCHYLDQYFSLLKPELSALDNLQRLAPLLDNTQARTALVAIGLTTQQWLQPVSRLSGGERMKLALLALTRPQPQMPLLLLDEPDNHLDMQAKAYLARQLAQWPGSFVLVSHDQHFASDCGCNQHLRLHQ
ncbi:ATP-binding cassette domain-containing protein [Alkalimonas mucilaginosa]|uniref:ATP-binding cassette domain-containing protein n=1 Tax=Alkalimonas mucilaginosa TaxID=3057676 RepID=A0ABU7JF59_9GAMM|nr:ATP-binding cassette domain-containing protein [Alkalimonas sp. MEB004]MEE2024334.1 ATP-binding cassette domain-containing protein [Alkalimonas sp. MEB004]